jgi:hypothetical protein
MSGKDMSHTDFRNTTLFQDVTVMKPLPEYHIIILIMKDKYHKEWEKARKLYY